MTVDPASLKCADALRVRSIESSRELDWQSALVEHQQILEHENTFETRPTPDQTIVVMTRGEQELEVLSGGVWRRATYRPGAVGLTPGGATDRLRRRVNREAGPACKINIYIPQALFDEAADQLCRGGSVPPTPLVAHGYVDAPIRYVALALLDGLREGASTLYADSAVCWLVRHLLTFGCESSSGDREVRQSAAIDKRIGRALELISHHYAEPVSIDELATESGVSKFHFARLFQQATGTTPYRHLRDTRLNAAKQLLLTTDLSISEVARKCGFGRPNHFTTQFRNRFSIGPRDLRLSGRSHG